MLNPQFSLSLVAPPAFCTEWDWTSIDAFVAVVIHRSGQPVPQSPRQLFEELRKQPDNKLGWFAPGSTVSIVSDDTDCPFFPLIASSRTSDTSPDAPILLEPSYLGRGEAKQITTSCPLISVNDMGIAFFIARPSSWRDGTIGRASVQLFHGCILLADATLVYELTSFAEPEPIQTTTGVFTVVFASYAREDLRIVQTVSSIVEACGLAEFRWDLKILRSGDKWSGIILEQIEDADCFQLFWSASAKKSKYVKREWQHALHLGRDGFIRPVYWQEPMPSPPKLLGHLHFSKVTI